jgi:hypothetical protein
MQQPSSAVARWRLKIRLLTISIRCFMIDTLYGFPPIFVGSFTSLPLFIKSKDIILTHFFSRKVEKS